MSQPKLDTAIDTAGAAVEDKGLDKESVIELLGDDDGKETETLELEEPKKTGTKDKHKEDEETGKEGKEGDEDKERTLEEELEEELEDDLTTKHEDELEVLEAPRRKEILAKYPEIFKDFPQLERAMYREQRYSEILPTIEDAQTAADKAQLLDNYEKEIYGGSTENLLSVVRDNDKEAFAKIVDNYLITLHKVDQHSYYHTIGNVIKHTIISMVKDSKEQKNDELESAAAILNQYIFGTDKFTHPQKLAKEEVENDGSKEKEEEISRKEREFLERQYNSAKDDLGARVDNIIKATVDKSIDPNNSMTDYAKKNAVRDVLENLESLVDKDIRFKSIFDKLWERAFANDFDKESMDRIKSAYLSKAKTLLPILIKKARNEALRGSNRRTSEDKDVDRKGPLPVGRTRSSTTLASGRANSGSNSKQIPKGMTSLEFLNSDD